MYGKNMTWADQMIDVIKKSGAQQLAATGITAMAALYLF
jgi:hypothetical protein